jgi:hypothetical protein
MASWRPWGHTEALVCQRGSIPTPMSCPFRAITKWLIRQPAGIKGFIASLEHQDPEVIPGRLEDAQPFARALQAERGDLAGASLRATEGGTLAPVQRRPSGPGPLGWRMP